MPNLDKDKVEKFKKGYPRPPLSDTLKEIGSDIVDFFTPRSNPEKWKEMRRKAKEERERREANEQSGQN